MIKTRFIKLSRSFSTRKKIIKLADIEYIVIGERECVSTEDTQLKPSVMVRGVHVSESDLVHFLEDDVETVLAVPEHVGKGILIGYHLVAKTDETRKAIDQPPVRFIDRMLYKLGLIGKKEIETNIGDLSRYADSPATLLKIACAQYHLNHQYVSASLHQAV